MATLDFRDEVEVLIWTKHNAGHIALELRSLPKGLANRRFISWWPGETTMNPLRKVTAQPQGNRQIVNRAEMSEGLQRTLDGLTAERVQEELGLQLRKGQKIITKGGFANGEWGQSAHEKVRLPLVGTRDNAGGSQSSLFGLYGDGILAWWTLRKASSAGYRFISATINCSGTAVEALEAGGATVFVPKPGGPIISPATVHIWADKLHAAMATVNTRFDECMQRVATSADPLVVRERGVLANDLFTVADFKKNAGDAATDADRAVDAALARYHAAPAWNAITGPGFGEKLGAMVTLMNAAHACLTRYPTAKQRDARYAITLLLCNQMSQRLDAVGTPAWT